MPSGGSWRSHVQAPWWAVRDGGSEAARGGLPIWPVPALARPPLTCGGLPFPLPRPPPVPCPLPPWPAVPCDAGGLAGGDGGPEFGFGGDACCALPGGEAGGAPDDEPAGTPSTGGSNRLYCLIAFCCATVDVSSACASAV